MIANLNEFSHSADFLEVLHTLKPPQVRKVFRKDLLRAKRSVEKQTLFAPLHTSMATLCSAEVLEFRTYIDYAELFMPYIHGMTGHMFPLYATRESAEILSSALSTMINFEMEDSIEKLVETSCFHEKLVSVSGATNDPHLRVVIGDCKSIIKKFPKEMVFPMGQCHGDLTLNNIILDQFAGVTLIDFLCTFLETPLQDVAKLKQDFSYGWSFRNDSSSLRIRGEIFCRNHIPHAVVEIEKNYPQQVYLLTLLALARIAPYVEDTVTQQWLIKNLTDCLRDCPV